MIRIIKYEQFKRLDLSKLKTSLITIVRFQVSSSEIFAIEEACEVYGIKTKIVMY